LPASRPADPSRCAAPRTASARAAGACTAFVAAFSTALSTALLTALPTAFLSACAGEPPLPELPLSDAAAALPDERRAALAADLAHYFGPSDAPAFAVLPGWRAAGFDPNAPAPTGASPALLERIEADNDQRWHTALARAAAGEAIDTGALPASLARAVEAADGATDDAVAAIRTWQPDLVASARLFARECATCHGVAGGGDGPSAATLVPPPRDFRSGTFVHRAVGPNPRPTQDDLVSVQRRGIAGTGMPLFARLGAARHSGLADWVRYLSLRGEFERAWLAHEDAHGRPPDTARMDELYLEAWSRWAILPDRPAPGAPAPDAAPNPAER